VLAVLAAFAPLGAVVAIIRDDPKIQR